MQAPAAVEPQRVSQGLFKLGRIGGGEDTFVWHSEAYDRNAA